MSFCPRGLDWEGFLGRGPLNLKTEAINDVCATLENLLDPLGR